MATANQWQMLIIAAVAACIIRSLTKPLSSQFLRRLDKVSQRRSLLFDPKTVQLKTQATMCTTNPFMPAMNVMNSDLINSANVWLNNMDKHIQEAADAKYANHDHERFFPFDPMGHCTELSCVGGECSSDKAKVTCGLSHLSNLEECVVYSFGERYDWSFELDILEKTQCVVHSFDCMGPKKRDIPNHKRLHFHHICLGATRSHGLLSDGESCTGFGQRCGDTWTMTDMQRVYSHNQIDLLKIDVEGEEWEIFDNVVEANYPMQILMEVHYDHNQATAVDLVRFQSHILGHGYVVVNRDDNPVCKHCTELTLLRIRC